MIDVVVQPAPSQQFQQQSEEPYSPPPPPPQTSYSQPAEEPRPPSPEARWTDKQPGKVSLYSQNVVQEPGQSTEDVDRESIANLATTRRQWEAIFGNDLVKKDEASSKSKLKKNPPKWEVRMPYTEKAHLTGPATASANNSSSSSSKPEVVESGSATNGTTMSENGNYTESAIEQEIRLAMEREEMLKKEHEEAMRAQEAMKASMTSSMQSSTESELHVQQQQQQPGYQYHELAEADRGAEFLVNEQAVQREDEEQEEALQRRFAHQRFSLTSSSNEDNGTESIIEREIRLQQEREAELAQMRGGVSPRAAPAPALTPAPVSQPAQRSSLLPAEEEEEEEVEPAEEIPYEDAISRYNHEGENRIAQELRELREREEEVRKLHERMNKTALNRDSEVQQDKKPATTPTPAASSAPVPKQTSKPVSAPQTPRGGVGSRSAPTTPRGGGDRAPTVNSPRGNVHASPSVQSADSPRTTTPRQETPIEREIRLARERENELRRAKGMPELQEPQKQPSFDAGDDEDGFVGMPRYYGQQPDSTLRQFASNRLQQEILDQRSREMKLRQEGKIITTSEEHIEPLKYSQVVGEDRTDGAAIKRNFKAPGRRSSGVPASEDQNGDASSGPQTPSRHPQHDSVVRKGPKSATASFSYREFAQTAESKIERELREMREREEELKKQRTGGAES